MKTTETFMRSSRVILHAPSIQKNWEAIRSRIPEKTRILPMVKANAYGHGDILFANSVQKLGAVGVGVADLGEAVSLREKKYDGLILCFGPVTKHTPYYARSLDFISTIHGEEELSVLNSCASDTPMRVHIKVDTGMNRWGFPQDSWTHAALELKNSKNLSIEGIYTHFAESNSPDHDFTRQQIERFNQAIQLFENTLGKRLIRHAANSSAIFNHPTSHFDWVRPGLALYGSAPSLSPVLEWKATICQIKKIATGDSVGYNRAFRAKTPQPIGIVGVGYGDGYLRSYADVGVFYAGQRRSILGIISMDALVVDLTNAPEARVGEEVTLIGRDPSMPTALDLALAAKTIPYEVFTCIQDRIPREIYE